MRFGCSGLEVWSERFFYRHAVSSDRRSGASGSGILVAVTRGSGADEGVRPTLSWKVPVTQN